jgi:replicative DNA helicase
MAIRPPVTTGGGSRASASPANERIPPHNLEAEESVLGSMLLSRDAIAEVLELLREDDFYRPAHRTVFNAILNLYSHGQAVDAITVAEELRRGGQFADIGGAPFLYTLVESVPTAANAAYYAQIVRDLGTKRRLIDAGTRIVQLGYDTPETERAIDIAESLVYQVAQGRTTDEYQALREVLTTTLEAIERIHNDHREITGVPSGFPELDRITSGFQPSNLIIIAARPAVGKALALDTPLPTPHGWTTMGEVNVGDQLIGADGKPTTVVAATEVMVGRPCYEVEFSDGTIIVADSEHQWLTETEPSRSSEAAAARGGNHGNAYRALPSVKTTAAIAATLDRGDSGRRLNHAVANAKPIALPERDLPLPPYALGVWLGRGDRAGAGFAADDPEIIVHLEAEGLQVAPSAAGTYRYGLTPLNRRGTVQAILRGLGVLPDKHIPAAYLRASEAQRRALLAGLLDAAGTVTERGAVRLSAASQRLAEDVQELIVSLGYHCGLTRRRVKGRTEASSTAYALTVAATDMVFWLERKRLLHKERMGSSRAGRRYITAVRSVPSVPVRCIQVDSSDHLYLASRSMIPTHNSTLGLDIVRNAAVKAGVTSVIFSLEMSRAELVQRLMCAECSVDMQRLRTGRMDESDWTRLTRSLGKLADAPLFIDDSPSTTLMEIRAKCRRLKQRHGLGLVVVDYLQLMQPTKKVDNRQQEVSEISRGLKLLAKELEVPVIAISQLSRNPEARSDKKPMLSDLRESGSLEQDADCVLFIYRDEVYDPESPRKGEADLILAKHRNGPTDTVVVTFQGQYSRFAPMAARSL